MLTEEKALDMLDKLAEETNDAILRINCISDEVIKFYKNNKMFDYLKDAVLSLTALSLVRNYEAAEKAYRLMFRPLEFEIFDRISSVKNW